VVSFKKRARGHARAVPLCREVHSIDQVPETYTEQTLVSHGRCMHGNTIGCLTSYGYIYCSTSNHHAFIWRHQEQKKDPRMQESWTKPKPIAMFGSCRQVTVDSNGLVTQVGHGTDNLTNSVIVNPQSRRVTLQIVLHQNLVFQDDLYIREDVSTREDRVRRICIQAKENTVQVFSLVYSNAEGTFL
jgi:hypothetical protein